MVIEAIYVGLLNWLIVIIRYIVVAWFNIGSTRTITMAQSNNYKAPPILTDGVDYENEKRALKFGECLLLWKKNRHLQFF